MIEMTAELAEKAVKAAQGQNTDAIRRAIDGARLTTAGLAERSGVSVRSLTAYRQRARTPCWCRTGR